MDKGKNLDELIIANREITFLNQEKENRAAELKVVYKEISFQIEERGKRAAELAIANIELVFQNEEKEKRAAELIIANEELAFQNQEKEKRAAELIIANEELAFQNQEKEKRAAELIIANSELKKAEADIRKLNAELAQKVMKRTGQYTFISQINQTIVHVKDAESLFRNSCRIALEHGKFKMAWIGSFDTAQKKITLLDCSGISSEDIKLFTDAPYEPNGPQDNVLRNGKYFLCNDVEHSLKLESWKPYAAKHNIRSCIVLPIKKSGNIFGTFNLYSTELNFFDKEDIALLEEVTGDISFALDLFDKANRHSEAEEIIIKNEKRFRTLIENSTDMITFSSKEGKMLYGSPSITKLFGYTTEEIINTSAFDFIHPDDIAEYAKNRVKLLECPNKSYHNQIRLKHKNGNWIWCESTITNWLEEEGINAMVSNFRDISEKKSIEEQQEFESNNLNALINNTKDLMWSVDRDFNLITSNIPFDEAGKVNFGKAIIKGENVLSVSDTPEMLTHFKQLYERAFEGESFTEIEHFDFPVELWTQISYCPIRKGDEVIGTACHSRDITTIKNSELELKNLSDRLLLATDSAKIGIWDWDTKKNVLIWDNNMYNIFNVARDEFSGAFEAWSNIVHPDDLQIALADVQAALDGTKDFHSFFRILWHNNEIRHVEGQAIILRDTDGKANRMIGVNRDITEQKIAEETKRKLTNDMIQRNQDLEQFTFIISHNLRAPTANIIGFAEHLQEETLTPQEQKECLQGLSASVSGLDTIIKDINSILQVKREVNEKKEQISFSKLVNDISISIGNIIDKNNFRIKPDFSEIDEFYSLKVYMHSIFYNLISNSIKYRKTDEQPLIEIKSKKENGKIILTFKDNGLGIDMKTKGDKVFGLYKRFHAHVEGKGMGLFMVKTQVEAIGGKITVASEVNKGTEFTIVFEN